MAGRLFPLGGLAFFSVRANIVKFCRLSGWIMCGSLLKAAVSVSVSASFPFEGKRNGGLDSLKTADRVKS